MRALRRKIAMLRLALVDADIARWFVDDGSLAVNDEGEVLPDFKQELRERRLRAVAQLERVGGRDPHPTFTRPRTPAQQRAWKERSWA